MNRTAWGRQFPFCWLCGSTENVVTHEIARGNHRHKAVKEPAAWLRLCTNCHENHLPPIAGQLALKRQHDAEHYDREAVNRLRRRAAGAITEAEVNEAERARYESQAAAYAQS